MLKRLEIVGFKSFAKKTILDFSAATTAIVGPNGSGKSNVSEAFRFALGEQSMKSMRGKRSEDLIWNGSASVPRSNRASVSIVFDNSAHTFNIDFDEVVITRTIFRDGESEYLINNSKVRLRDIAELLAGANVGESGHHIISQGEADRILLASPKERREMLEDALGLRVYEFKKQEAVRKLDKTEENISQIESLRRELAPHLRFLASQVEKLERREELVEKFRTLAKTYFAIEDITIAKESTHIREEKTRIEETLGLVSKKLRDIEEHATVDERAKELLEAMRNAETAVTRIVDERGTLARELGRIEGALEATTEHSKKSTTEPYAKIPRVELITLAEEVEKQYAESATPDAISAALKTVATVVKRFVDRFVAPRDDLLSEEENAVYKLSHEREALLAKDEELRKRYEDAQHALIKAREDTRSHDEAGREEKRQLLEYAEQKAQKEGALASLVGKEQVLQKRVDDLDRDKTEAVTLGGSSVLSYEPLSEVPDELHGAQDERRRQFERLSVRLEEAGDANEDIRKEHKETVEREAFLSRELEDLHTSAESLRTLLNDLDTELTKHFENGLLSVNTSLTEYFSLLFGGGSARLTLEEPDESAFDEAEEETKGPKRLGLEIAVSLPKKKVRSLLQLSGGERALTSIALIFAMSQVNPPPFLILDETDAALDEANSIRYGDMIEALSKRSQLIVITHNRGTMSRAGILYGVTMGSDGVSKLLSVKFEEAVAVAK